LPNPPPFSPPPYYRLRTRRRHFRAQTVSHKRVTELPTPRGFQTRFGGWALDQIAYRLPKLSKIVGRKSHPIPSQPGGSPPSYPVAHTSDKRRAKKIVRSPACGTRPR
jgi:hypothetical protein